MALITHVLPQRAVIEYPPPRPFYSINPPDSGIVGGPSSPRLSGSRPQSASSSVVSRDSDVGSYGTALSTTSDTKSYGTAMSLKHVEELDEDDEEHPFGPPAASRQSLHVFEYQPPSSPSQYSKSPLSNNIDSIAFASRLEGIAPGLSEPLSQPTELPPFHVIAEAAEPPLNPRRQDTISSDVSTKPRKGALRRSISILPGLVSRRRRTVSISSRETVRGQPQSLKRSGSRSTSVSTTSKQGRTSPLLRRILERLPSNASIRPSRRGSSFPEARKSGSSRPRTAPEATARSSAENILASFASQVNSIPEVLPPSRRPSGPLPAADGASGSTLPPTKDFDACLKETMIGEYVLKHTRSLVGGGYSGKQHPRFIWLNHHTRTLFWGNCDPASSADSHSTSKSVVVLSFAKLLEPYFGSNDRQYDIYHIIIVSRNRDIKLTFPNRERYEVWCRVLEHILDKGDKCPNTP